MPTQLSTTAVQQGYRRVYDQKGSIWEVHDIRKKMARIHPFETPFVNMLFLSNLVKWRQTANLQGLFQFPEKEYMPNKTGLLTYEVGAGADADTIITFTVNEPDIFIPGVSIKIVDTGETGIVINNVAGTIRAKRDLDSSNNTQNWSALVIGGNPSYVLTIGEAKAETDSTPESVVVNPYMRTGRVQLFTKAISATDMFIAASMHGGLEGGDWFADDTADKIYEMKRDMEMAMWHNNNHFIDRDSVTNGVITKLEGIPYQIRNNEGFIHNHGGTLDKTNIYAFFNKAKRGKRKKSFFIGDEVMNAIEDMIESKTSLWEPIKRYGPIAGDDTINVLQIRRANIIVDCIRVPHFEDNWVDKGFLLEDGSIFGCYFAPDKKGSRRFRFEQKVNEQGEPLEEAKVLAHVGVGIGECPHNGIFEN